MFRIPAGPRSGQRAYAVDHGHPQLAEEASRALDALTLGEKGGAEAVIGTMKWDAEGVGSGVLTFNQGPLQDVGDLPFIDYQDQLPLPSAAWFPEPLEVETRQCLCLHVTAALTGERSLTGVRTAAVALRQEMLQESVEAFA